MRVPASAAAPAAEASRPGSARAPCPRRPRALPPGPSRARRRSRRAALLVLSGAEEQRERAARSPRARRPRPPGVRPARRRRRAAARARDARELLAERPLAALDDLARVLPGANARSRPGPSRDGAGGCPRPAGRARRGPGGRWGACSRRHSTSSVRPSVARGRCSRPRRRGSRGRCRRSARRGAPARRAPPGARCRPRLHEDPARAASRVRSGASQPCSVSTGGARKSCSEFSPRSS